MKIYLLREWDTRQTNRGGHAGSTIFCQQRAPHACTCSGRGGERASSSVVSTAYENGRRGQSPAG